MNDNGWLCRDYSFGSVVMDTDQLSLLASDYARLNASTNGGFPRRRTSTGNDRNEETAFTWPLLNLICTLMRTKFAFPSPVCWNRFVSKRSSVYVALIERFLTRRQTRLRKNCTSSPLTFCFNSRDRTSLLNLIRTLQILIAQHAHNMKKNM